MPVTKKRKHAGVFLHAQKMVSGLFSKPGTTRKSHNADYVAFVMPAGQLKEQIQLFQLAAVFRSG